MLKTKKNTLRPIRKSQIKAKKLASISHEISKDILDGEEKEYYQDREETSQA